MGRTLVCDVAALAQADLDVIDLLARLQLVAFLGLQDVLPE